MIACGLVIVNHNSGLIGLLTNSTAREGRCVMGQVIRFPQSAIREMQMDALDAPAEIVIFPGVRIERREFNLSDRMSSGKRAKPRPRPETGSKANNTGT